MKDKSRRLTENSNWDSRRWDSRRLKWIAGEYNQVQVVQPLAVHYGLGEGTRCRLKQMTREHKVLQGCVLQLIYFPRAHLCPKTEEQTVGIQSNIPNWHGNQSNIQNWQGNLNVTSRICRVTKVTSRIGVVTKVTSRIGRVTRM